MPATPHTDRLPHDFGAAPSAALLLVLLSTEPHHAR